MLLCCFSPIAISFGSYMDKAVGRRACTRKFFTQCLGLVSVMSQSCLGLVAVMSRSWFGVAWVMFFAIGVVCWANFFFGDGVLIF